jgi:hypothetical protein
MYKSKNNFFRILFLYLLVTPIFYALSLITRRGPRDIVSAYEFTFLFLLLPLLVLKQVVIISFGESKLHITFFWMFILWKSKVSFDDVEIYEKQTLIDRGLAKKIYLMRITGHWFKYRLEEGPFFDFDRATVIEIKERLDSLKSIST